MTQHDPLDEQFREIGFTGAARNFRRTPEAQEAFEACYGQMPPGTEYPLPFKFAPNETAYAAWERVGDLIRAARKRGE